MTPEDDARDRLDLTFALQLSLVASEASQAPGGPLHVLSELLRALLDEVPWVSAYALTPVRLWGPVTPQRFDPSPDDSDLSPDPGEADRPRFLEEGRRRDRTL